MMPHWEDVTNRLTRISLSPTGKRVLVEARGEIFTVPSDKGDVRNLSHSSGSAEHEPRGRPTANTSRTSATARVNTSVVWKLRTG